MNEYIPELGQMCFGQPSQQFETPEHVIAALEYLAVIFDDKQVSDNNPFRNTGWKWCNNVFEVNAYNWNEDIVQEYNFKYKDILISWYKYLNRGMSINRFVSIKECWIMLTDCANSVLDTL